jgi:hypothetical protein
MLARVSARTLAAAGASRRFMSGKEIKFGVDVRGRVCTALIRALGTHVHWLLC